MVIYGAKFKLRPSLTVTGGWSPWTEWTECSSARMGFRCGPGSQRRQRICDSPAPRWGGAYCPGAPVQKNKCETVCKGECMCAKTY